jgi:hypothetical protein
MFGIFGKKSSVKLVEDGEFEKRRCPKCDETTIFREVEVDNSITAYKLVELFEWVGKAFMCEACDEIMDLEDTLEPESGRERAERRAEEAVAKREKEIAEREAAAEKARKEREQKEQEMKETVDDELAALKRKLGMD